MTVRNLNAIFKPASIAVIGASKKPQSIGQVAARNLFHAGFDGPIMPVNPVERAVEGVLTYKTVADLPLSPDLAVFCGPSEQAAATIGQLGEKGCKGVIVLSGGFDSDGVQKLREAARPYLMRVLGPNSLGVMAPGRNLNASICHIAPKKGDIALVAQSSMMVTSVVDWATARGFGFSHLVSLGDKADVDHGDMLDYLAAEPMVRAILLYIEGLSNARKFMSAARTAARQKPVIVVKAGRSQEARDEAASHTGTLAVSDAVYDAAFARAGILRVNDLDELFDAVGTLSTGVPITGDRLAIVTNGGGIGVMATDSVIQLGGRMAQFGETTQARLGALGKGADCRRNPVRLGADAPPARYAEALTTLLEDQDNDAVLMLHCPNALVDSDAVAQAVIEAHKSFKGRKHPVLTSWVGDRAAAQARRLFAEAKIPTYDAPSHAVRAFTHLVQYKRNQELLMETPPSVPEEFDPDMAAVRAVIDAAAAEGRHMLSEYEGKQVLAAYGVPVVQTRFVETADGALRAAREIPGPWALKILSHDILHKSDVGGVALNLDTPEAVREEVFAMLERVRKAQPDAHVEGFTVQQMVDRQDAYELIVGMTDNPLFGPVLLFGEGGIGVEVVEDYALSLPPLNMKLARDQMARTRIWKQLQGYRSRAAIDVDAVALTLNKVSQLVIDFPEIVELDINPLLADENGVLALDARIRLGAQGKSQTKPAIRPYPKKLEGPLTIRDGRTFLCRPILPEDEPLVHEMFAHMTPEDIRLRFFAPMKKLSHQAAARLTQIDYDREMGLIAVATDPESGEKRMFGVVRIAADPDNVRAEYAVMVRSDMKGQGLGYLLMRRIIEYAKTRGLTEVYGEVLRENTNMLAMCRTLGFVRKENLDEPGVVEVRIDLSKDLGDAP